MGHKRIIIITIMMIEGSNKKKRIIRIILVRLYESVNRVTDRW